MIRESLPAAKRRSDHECPVLHLGQRPRGGASDSPGRTRKKQLCVVRGPQLRSWLSLPAPSVCLLGAADAELREFQQEQPFWGPARDLHHKRQRGRPSWALLGVTWQKIPYAETPPRHPCLLCLCVFVHHSHNRNKKASYSLFKEVVFCWGKDATA